MTFNARFAWSWYRKRRLWHRYGLRKEWRREDQNRRYHCLPEMLWPRTCKGGQYLKFISHLKTHHPTLHGLVCSVMKSKKKEQQHSSYIDEQQQPTITSTLKKVQKYNRQTKKWSDITNAVAFCLSKDSLPIYTVEKLRFCNLLEKMDPQYDLPLANIFQK